jgi:hypothetical protein
MENKIVNYFLNILDAATRRFPSNTSIADRISMAERRRKAIIEDPANALYFYIRTELDDYLGEAVADEVDDLSEVTNPEVVAAMREWYERTPKCKRCSEAEKGTLAEDIILLAAFGASVLLETGKWKSKRMRKTEFRLNCGR